jgi:hypothetical protein
LPTIACHLRRCGGVKALEEYLAGLRMVNMGLPPRPDPDAAARVEMVQWFAGTPR